MAVPLRCMDTGSKKETTRTEQLSLNILHVKISGQTLVMFHDDTSVLWSAFKWFYLLPTICIPLLPKVKWITVLPQVHEWEIYGIQRWNMSDVHMLSVSVLPMSIWFYSLECWIIWGVHVPSASVLPLSSWVFSIGFMSVEVWYTSASGIEWVQVCRMYTCQVLLVTSVLCYLRVPVASVEKKNRNH